MQCSQKTPYKQIAWTALLIALSLGFVQAFFPTSDSSSDPLSLLVNIVFTIAIGTPLLLGLILINVWVARWWRARHPLPPPPARESVESFSWTGRPSRADLKRVVVPIALIGILMGATFLMTSLALGPSAPLSILILLGFAFFAIVALGIAFMGRTMTFEVEEHGVRVAGMRRADFTLNWKDVGRIEFVALEKMFPFFGVIPGPRVPAMRWYAFLDRDGKFLAGLTPATILNQELQSRLEAALLTQASRHGIPAVEVRWRDAFRWRKPKLVIGST